ncbi:hypothetical protein QVA66_07230 [Staphylococcus chromogenes]|nr:hypothetical protein [Staphylococcus chromogenes]
MSNKPFNLIGHKCIVKKDISRSRDQTVAEFNCPTMKNVPTPSLNILESTIDAAKYGDGKYYVQINYNVIAGSNPSGERFFQSQRWTCMDGRCLFLGEEMPETISCIVNTIRTNLPNFRDELCAQTDFESAADWFSENFRCDRETAYYLASLPTEMYCTAGLEALSRFGNDWTKHQTEITTGPTGIIFQSVGQA